MNPSSQPSKGTGKDPKKVPAERGGTPGSQQKKKDVPGDLPTPDRASAKEHDEDPADESVASDPGSFQLPGNQYSKSPRIDTNTMSDQPDLKNPKA